MASVNLIHRGYGDFNGNAGFHPGVDIAPPNPNSLIGNVFPNLVTTRETFRVPGKDEWVVLTDTPGTLDILYEHVFGNQANSYLVGDVFTSDLGNPCSTPDPGYGSFMHVHISYYDSANWPAPPFNPDQGDDFPEPGVENIINDFPYSACVILSDVCGNSSGVQFCIDDSFFPLEVVRGSVDAIISPHSTVSGSLNDDYAGVRSIEYSINRKINLVKNMKKGYLLV